MSVSSRFWDPGWLAQKIARRARQALLGTVGLARLGLGCLTDSALLVGPAPEAGTQALPHSARCVRVHPTPDHPTNVHLGFRNIYPQPPIKGVKIRVSKRVRF